jgi:excisionase family DNA binding protein
MPDKPSLFTAAQLAKFCAVDQKTIHNWVDKGSIEAFRTPGRHLRFKAAAVEAFLKKFGYDVPVEVAGATTEGTAKVEDQPS